MNKVYSILSILIVLSVLCTIQVSAWSTNQLYKPEYETNSPISVQQVIRSGSFQGDVAEMYDGDFSTSSFFGTGDKDLLINYTLPTGVSNNSKLRVKAGLYGDNNVTLTNCFNQTDTTLAIKITVNSSLFTSSLSCYKNGWQTLISGDYDYLNVFYEESTIWNSDFFTSENLTLTTNQSIIRYLQVPQGILLTNTILNILSRNSTIMHNRTINNTQILTTLTETDAIGGAINIGFKFTPNRNLTLTNVTIADAARDPVNIILRNSTTILTTSLITSLVAGFNYPLVYGNNYSLEANYTLGGTVLINSTFLNNVPITYSDFTILNRTISGADVNGGFLYAISSIGYNSTVLTNNENRVINISINNDTQIYSASGQFLNATINNFSQSIIKYLNTCSYLDGYCQVPIDFKVNKDYIVRYFDLNFNNFGINYNNVSYNNSVTELTLQNFSLNVSYDPSYYTSASARLFYNGTFYTSTKSGSGFNYTFSNNFYIPSVTANANQTFNWEVTLNNGTTNEIYNSTSLNQSVYFVNMSICGAAPYNIPFLNYTFHNETLAGEAVNATFDTYFTYWIDSVNVNKTYHYVSAVETNRYTFCFTPSTVRVNVSATGTYSNSYSQSRNFVNTSMPLTSTMTTKDLLLLPNSNGIYITFVIQDNYNARISGALIDVKKTSDGSSIGQAYTDSTGIAAFWLSTTTSYTITVSKSGYTSSATGITPVSSPVSITLTAISDSGGGVSPNINSGIRIRLNPMDERLTNNTIYRFQFNISSSQDSLDSYGFSLWNMTEILSSVHQGTQPEGEDLETIMDTVNQTYIILKYYYIIDGNITNGSKKYYINNLDGSEYSIAHSFDTLNNYLSNSSSGILGIKKGTSSGDFSLAIIIFIIMMFSAGIMTYKFGITSITAVTFLIFSMILFLDVGAGLIPNPVDAVPHFISIFAGFILVGMFVREMV